MNNVFRLIWNRTLGRLVVASEAARSNDKSATQQGVVGQLPAPEAAAKGVPALLRPAVIAVALAAGSMVLVAPEARAWELTNDADDCGFNIGDTNTRVAAGNATACADGATAIGDGARASEDEFQYNTVAIGTGFCIKTNGNTCIGSPSRTSTVVIT